LYKVIHTAKNSRPSTARRVEDYHFRYPVSMNLLPERPPTISFTIGKDGHLILFSYVCSKKRKKINYV
jgi:hypothetical protein